MDFRWLGPYTIEKNLGKGAYLLRHDAGKSSKRMNRAHMKPYFDPPDDTNPLMMNLIFCLTMFHFIMTHEQDHKETRRLETTGKRLRSQNPARSQTIQSSRTNHTKQKETRRFRFHLKR